MNTNIQVLKDLIKEKADYQIKLKQNRKTVNFTGERLKYTYRVWNSQTKRYKDVEKDMHPSTATGLISGTYPSDGTKHELRLLYAAYGLLRGKPFSKTESVYPEETHPLHEYEQEIMKIVNQYKDEEC